MSAAAETMKKELIVKRTRMERVLELFHAGEHSTDAIARALDISEREVCAILDEVDRGR